MSRQDRSKSESENTRTSDGDMDILEHNVEQLLTRAHKPPVMADDARARVLSSLKSGLRERKAREPAASSSPWRWRWRYAGFGLAAAALAGLLIWRAGAESKPSGEAVASPSLYQNPGPAPQRVVLGDGTELILNGDTEIRVEGKRHLRLVRGDVMLDVAKSPTGDAAGAGKTDSRGDSAALAPFRIDAPHGRIVVLGTRFVVNAEADKTLAAVVRGKVRIENRQGVETLRAGEQGILEPGKKPVRRSAPRLSHLTSWAKGARVREEGKGEKPIRRGTLLARNPQWQIQDYPLPLRDFTVDVYVEDQVARVAVDQTFFNAQPMELEGVYRFPLPAGAAISRLAMYVDGKRMEAAVVERQRGRRIYESIVYRRRDPALLEWMAGNLFKIRIYPLPARQEKRIVMSYTQTLDRLYDDVRLEVPIPEVDTPVDRVRYRVRLAGCAECLVHSTSHAIESKKDGDDKLVTFSRDGYEIGDDLILTIRDPAAPAQVATLDRGTEHYWRMRVKPDLSAAESGEHTPRRWVLMHDTSASRGAMERKAQTFLIDRLLRELDEDDEVNIIAFDATVRTWASGFRRIGDIDSQQRREVRNFLAENSADGVGYTDLRHGLAEAVKLLEAAVSPETSDYRPHILYLGDGVATGGDDESDRSLPGLRKVLGDRATFVAVAVGESLDDRLLGGLAAATGGMFAAMNPGDDLGWRAFDLVAALNTPRVTDLEVSLIGPKSRIDDSLTVYPSTRQLADGEELDIVARFRTVDARGVIGSNPPARPRAVELRGTLAGKPWQQRLDLADLAELDEVKRRDKARYLPRLWARRHVDRLIAEGARDHEKELTRLGKKYFLMTPFTSLLVLENDAMYKRYNVKRDRERAWAGYELPKRIEVVHEPLGSVVADSRTAILVRSPVQIFSQAAQLDGFDFSGLDMNGAEGVIDDMLGGGIRTRSEAIRVAGSSGVLGTLRGFGKSAEEVARAAADSPAEPSLVLENKPDPNMPIQAEAAADEDAQFGGEVVTTGALRDQTVRWSGANSTSRAGPRRRSRRLAQLMQSNPAWREIAGARGWGGGGAGRGGLHHYYSYGYNAPWPQAFHYHSDPRLSDLTEFVPGLFEDALDGDARDLRTRAGKGHRGSITDEARALVGKVRAAAGPAHYRHGDGQVLSVDKSGRFTIARRTPMDLDEEIRYTGEWLYHIYPELGLITRRHTADLEALIYDHWLPFRMPSAAALSRWYHVSAIDAETLRLSASRDENASYIEIALDRELRVSEVRSVGPARSVPGEKRSVTVKRRFEYGENTVTMIEGKRRVELAIAAGDATEVDTDVDPTAAIVDLPLRQPGYWTEKIAATEAGKAEWRHMHGQLLASYAALGRHKNLAETLLAMREIGELSRGELALGSGAVHAIVKAADITRLVGKADSPVAEYVRTSYRLLRRYRAGLFTGLIKSASEARPHSLIAMLARYREVLIAVANANRGTKVRQRVATFIADYPSSPLTYIAVYNASSRWRWQDRDSAVLLWDKLQGTPFADVAGYEAARVLAQAGRYDDAVARFEKLFVDADEFRIDGTVSSAFINSSVGRAGWRRFWIHWRDRMLTSDDPGRLGDVIRAAQQTGEYQDIDRMIARATQLTPKDPMEAVSLADVLSNLGRDEAALTVLEPWLAKQEKVAAPVADDPEREVEDAVAVGLWSRAGAIAERQGRYREAAEYFVLVMSRSGATELGELRAEYRRLVGLYSKVAQSRPGTERGEAVKQALAALSAWRALDPANSEIDSLAATLLYSVGRPEEAWRYLSTAIERQPMEGTSYQVVADVLEREGMVREAEPLWRRAFEVDPTNPTWLLRRAQALFAMGEKAEGRSLIAKITAAKWHERFASVTWQAKNLARR